MANEDWELFFAGDEYPDDQQDHLRVLLEAFGIYHEKDAIRGPMWREFPPSDKIRELVERGRRMDRAMERLDHGGSHLNDAHLLRALEEDALDVINYAVFLVRQIREGVWE